MILTYGIYGAINTKVSRRYDEIRNKLVRREFKSPHLHQTLRRDTGVIRDSIASGKGFSSQLTQKVNAANDNVASEMALAA